MKFVDLSDNPRLARLVDLTSALRKCKSPYDALLMYCTYLADAYPGRAGARGVIERLRWRCSAISAAAGRTTIRPPWPFRFASLSHN